MASQSCANLLARSAVILPLRRSKKITAQLDETSIAISINFDVTRSQAINRRTNAMMNHKQQQTRVDWSAMEYQPFEESFDGRTSALSVPLVCVDDSNRFVLSRVCLRTIECSSARRQFATMSTLEHSANPHELTNTVN